MEKTNKTKNKYQISNLFNKIFNKIVELHKLGEKIDNIHLRRVITGVLVFITLLNIFAIIFGIPIILISIIWQFNHFIVYAIIIIIVMYTLGLNILSYKTKPINKKEVNKNGRK